MNFDHKEFHVHMPITTRFRDCDPMGHVNNSVYMTYLEQSRFYYFRNLGYDFTKDPETFSFILTEIRCRFLSPALFDEDLLVHIRVSTMRKARFDFEYVITGAKEKVVAMARSDQVSFRWEDQKLKAIPPDVKAKISYLEERKFD